MNKLLLGLGASLLLSTSANASTLDDLKAEFEAIRIDNAKHTTRMVSILQSLSLEDRELVVTTKTTEGKPLGVAILNTLFVLELTHDTAASAEDF